MNENRAGLGYQDFEKVRTQHIFYIDKKDFIREWWEYADKVTLITRPRRFGKTLNMSMTECIFSNKYKDRSDLFEELSIWEEKSPDGEYKYRKLQGTFPVIFLSLQMSKQLIKPCKNRFFLWFSVPHIIFPLPLVRNFYYFCPTSL